MRLTRSQLQVGIQSPAALARDMLARDLARQADAEIRRNPQRQWIEGSVRTYVRTGRQPDRLLRDYDDRTARAQTRDRNASAIANGRRMLERFAQWDAGQPSPIRCLEPAVAAGLLGHQLTLTHDLVHATDDGLVIRQLVTEDGMRRLEHRRIFAVATLLHARAAGLGDVVRIEVWHLRLIGPVGWPSSLLLRRVPELAASLVRISVAVTGDAA
jgi:hypothetical protein